MTARVPRCVLVVAAGISLAACDATATGRAAFEAGRYGDARAAFGAAAASAGDDASPELLYDVALAALRDGDPIAAGDAAATAASVAAARGRTDVAALASFVRGNSAWARCDAAEDEASRPGADSTALDRAIAHAETALSAWRDAAVSRDDWPEARRNAERAVRRLATLRKQKIDDPNRKDPGAPPRPPSPTSPDTQPPPAPPPDVSAPPPPPRPTGAADDASKDPRAALTTDELPQAEVLRVLETLAAKEREKTDVRRARRDAPQPGVERDW